MAEEHWVERPDTRLHVAVWGEASAPLVVCAHGYPDCAATYDLMAPALVEAGMRVAAVTMRGYAPSEPSREGKYAVRDLAADLLAVGDALSPDAPVALVGHDWGAAAAYVAAATTYRVRALVTMAVPHLRVAWRRWLHPRQMHRSRYMLRYQRAAATAEVMADGMAEIDRLWREWSPGYRCPEDRMAKVKAAIGAHPDGPLGYYRALASSAARPAGGLDKTRVPSLYIHGVDDGCIGVEVVDGTEAAYGAPVRVERIDGAGHFVHLEQPERVNALVVEHLTR